MPRRKATGPQIPTIIPGPKTFDPSFNLPAQDALVTGLGVQFAHFAAIPSPIGLKDRGDYRRPDGDLDTITSNGSIYRKVGAFTGCLLSNSKNSSFANTGTIEQATARIVMPRFYDQNNGVANGGRIKMAPGDRIYINDPSVDTSVANYQKMEYSNTDIDVPMFPICKVEFLIDSRNIEYKEGADFKISPQGNIQWLVGGRNPGIDLDTGKGRVYSIRYHYRGWWYVSSIINELRLSAVTTGSTRQPERMSEHISVIREYAFHNANASKEAVPTGRTVPPPVESIIEQKDAQVSVNVSDFTMSEDD